MSQPEVHVSVVTPVYKNEASIRPLCRRLEDLFAQMDISYEIIFVCDGSPDNSWREITLCAEENRRVSGVAFPRNFGQHVAITAGLDHTRGEYVVVMDADLQDQPEAIADLYKKIREGYEVVHARRVGRTDSRLRRLLSRLFYRVFDLLADTRSDPAIANFGIYSRRAVDYFLQMRERHRLFPLFMQWLGFNTAAIDVEHGKSGAGGSAYTLRKRFQLALNTILSMSNKPLKLAVKWGFWIAFIAFLLGIFVMAKYLVWGVPLQGWTSLIVSLFFIGGLLLCMLGVLGLYIARIFDEVKGRPLYVIAETIGRIDREADRTS